VNFGAEARLCFLTLMARLKSCPFTKPSRIVTDAIFSQFLKPVPFIDPPTSPENANQVMGCRVRFQRVSVKKCRATWVNQAIRSDIVILYIWSSPVLKDQ